MLRGGPFSPRIARKKSAEFSGGPFVYAPGYDPIFRGLAADRSEYFTAVDELLNGPFSETFKSQAWTRLERATGFRTVGKVYR